MAPWEGMESPDTQKWRVPLPPVSCQRVYSAHSVAGAF